MSLGSRGLVLATAMVVSSTVLFLAFSRQKGLFPENKESQDEHFPRSCLYSEEKKRERRRKEKKRVKFAENVKEPSGNGKEFRNEQRNKKKKKKNCGNQMKEIPGNQMALYSGIIRDRVQRTQCSY